MLKRKDKMKRIILFILLILFISSCEKEHPGYDGKCDAIYKARIEYLNEIYTDGKIDTSDYIHYMDTIQLEYQECLKKNI